MSEKKEKEGDFPQIFCFKLLPPYLVVIETFLTYV
jgi:hypothetical protein